MVAFLSLNWINCSESFWIVSSTKNENGVAVQLFNVFFFTLRLRWYVLHTFYSASLSFTRWIVFLKRRFVLCWRVTLSVEVVEIIMLDLGVLQLQFTPFLVAHRCNNIAARTF